MAAVFLLPDTFKKKQQNEQFCRSNWSVCINSSGGCLVRVEQGREALLWAGLMHVPQTEVCFVFCGGMTECLHTSPCTQCISQMPFVSFYSYFK